MVVGPCQAAASYMLMWQGTVWASWWSSGMLVLVAGCPEQPPDEGGGRCGTLLICVMCGSMQRSPWEAMIARAGFRTQALDTGL